MIKLAIELPRDIYIACSGGVDSMAALDFLRRNHNVTVAFFDHGTAISKQALEFLRNYCDKENIKIVDGAVMRSQHKDESLEEYWRSERYRYFDYLNGPIVTAHHLDDAVETWIWSSMHGNPKLPKIRRGNILRPFLATVKADLTNWCIRKNVPWQEDHSNNDIKFTRNYVRHEMMPHVLKVNPGISKVIKKKILSQCLSK